MQTRNNKNYLSSVPNVRIKLNSCRKPKKNKWDAVLRVHIWWATSTGKMWMCGDVDVQTFKPMVSDWVRVRASIGLKVSIRVRIMVRVKIRVLSNSSNIC